MTAYMQNKRVEIFSITSNFEDAESEWDEEIFFETIRKKAAIWHFEPDKLDNSDSLVLEKVYDVKVVRINIVNTMGKRKVRGKISGQTSNVKKAIVTLKAGQQIT